MNSLLKVVPLVAILSPGLVGSAFAAGAPADAASIPEPSVALLGGLCGIFFLLWRRK